MMSNGMEKSRELLWEEGEFRVMRISPSDDKMHQHVFFELVYVMHGSAVHRLGSDAARLREGDFFIVDKGSFHCYQETDAFEIVNCLFLPEFEKLPPRALLHTARQFSAKSVKFLRDRYYSHLSKIPIKFAQRASAEIFCQSDFISKAPKNCDQEHHFFLCRPRMIPLWTRRLWLLLVLTPYSPAKNF